MDEGAPKPEGALPEGGQGQPAGGAGESIAPEADDTLPDRRVTHPEGLDVETQRQRFLEGQKREEERRPEERRDDFREGPKKRSGGGLPDSRQVA